VPDLIVTGTDTEVGKTVIAAALLMALRRDGVRAIGFKPAESGRTSETRTSETPPDSDVLAMACGVEEELAHPLLRLAEPLTPALAAERAGLRLDPAEVADRVRRLRAAGYTLVVEGAGGLLAPLAWDFNSLDLAKRCGLEAVIVARAGLGTLNHVCLTVEALRRADVPIRGVVLNRRGDPPGLAELTNPDVLARLLPGLPIVTIAEQQGLGPLQAAERIHPMLPRTLVR
jgi:dethiobiotin synthetase